VLVYADKALGGAMTKKEKDKHLIAEGYKNGVCKLLGLPFSEWCALCATYSNKVGMNTCLECPVYMQTGEPDCMDTPYEEMLLHEDGPDHFNDPHFNDPPGCHFCQTCYQIIFKGLDFLKELYLEQ